MTEPRDIPATLRAIRKNLDLTQEELAERLDVSFASVNRWEGGKVRPQRASREAIAALAKETATTPRQASESDHSARRREKGGRPAEASASSDATPVKRCRKSKRWENQEAPGWSVDDLDEWELRNVVAQAVYCERLDVPEHRGVKDLLRQLGLMRGDVVYRAVAVLFGKRERLELDFPQCVLRVARFRGVDRSTSLDNRQFAGNAFELLRAGERFLRDWVPIAGRFDPNRFDRIDEPLYPTLATREALANALCHRDYAIFGGSIGLAMYDDRMEITSPGPLHFGLTPEDLFVPHRSRLWNPWIARTFYRRGIIEMWGTGTIRMVEEAAAAGLPRPEIEEHGDSVIVRFRQKPVRPERVSEGEGAAPTRTELLVLLEGAARGLTRRELLSGVRGSFSEAQLRRMLEELRDEGLAARGKTAWHETRMGSSSGGRQAEWRRRKCGNWA